MDMATLKITKANFETEVLGSDKPVLIDFWAAWCGPCRMVGPVVEEISEEVNTVKVGKINVDEEQELAMKYGVMSIPTLIVFEKGQVKDKIVGAHPKASILKMLGK
jgi:thioredoxin 1